VIDIDPGYQKLCGKDALAYPSRWRRRPATRTASSPHALRCAAPLTRSSAPPSRHAPRASRAPSGKATTRALVDARRAGEDRAIVAARRLDFPFYFPTRVTKTASYVGDTARTYTLRDSDGNEHDAYRLVLSTNRVGEYYGVQGTTWRDPPILEEPNRTVRRNGRTLLVFGDGGRVRMVAWRTRGAVYRVSNTRSRTLGERELAGIAASLAR
jgi:polyisoprenyl-teichoic acid--peptidoglycan teichoic acid transferase